MNRLTTSVEPAPSVLVLTDFSKASNEALRWARWLAANHKANLKVLYPYRLTRLTTSENAFQIRKTIELDAKNTFSKVAETVFNDDTPNYDFRAEVGFLNERVYSHTRKEEVLLVVVSAAMAIANKEGLNELVENISSPLLIVPANAAEVSTDISKQLSL